MIAARKAQRAYEIMKCFSKTNIGYDEERNY